MVRVPTLPPTKRGMYVDGKFIKPENVRTPKPPPPPPPPKWS